MTDLPDTTDLASASRPSAANGHAPDAAAGDWARWMRRCLDLAARGAGRVSPNPRVGAMVLGPDGAVLGEGWHRRYGGPHAEAFAIQAAEAAHGPRRPAHGHPRRQPRAVQPPRQDAPVRRPHRPQRHSARRRGHGRPLSRRRRARPRPAARARRGRDGGRPRRRVPRGQRRLRPPRADEPPARDAQDGADARRLRGHHDGRRALGDGRGRACLACTAGAPRWTPSSWAAAPPAPTTRA